MSNENQPSNALDSILGQFNTINDCLTLFKMQINTLQQKVKQVEKNVCKELKVIKKQNKNVKIKQKRAPSGFAKPTKVTNALCEFMDRPEGTEIARTEVTKTLIQYIKSNNLLEQGNTSKQKIVPDLKLKSLLGIDEYETSELTYFNIQKYMNKHFISNKGNIENSVNNS
jgi:chromatin remodeling complex protein RSC6